MLSSKTRQLIGLMGIIFGAIAADFNSQVVTNAMGDVSGGLGLGHDAGTWFNSLYISAEVFGMAMSPWLLVTFTLRQFTLFVFLLNAVSSVLIPFSPDIPALYALRVMQGLSGGLTIPLLMTTALRVLDPGIKLYGLAIYAITVTVMPPLSTSMAALWTSEVGWRFVFLEAVPLCAVAAVLVWFGEEQDKPDYARFRIFDWRGALLVLVGLGSFTTMLQQGDRLDWFNSPLICVLALVSVIAIPLLIVNEWFHELPLLKIQLLGRRNLAYGGIALFAFILISQSGSAVPNDFLRNVQGLRPEQYYPVTLLITVAQIVMLPAMAVLLDYRRVDARIVHLLGLGLILIACLGCTNVTTHWFGSQFYVWQTLQAIGQPMVTMTLLLLSTNMVRGPDEAPFASALINTPRAIAEATGVWLIQLIDRWRGGLHYNRLADQAGQERWTLIQGMPTPPHMPPPLMPDGQPRAPGSLVTFQQMIERQAQVLTISDTYWILAGLTMALMLVLLVLTERTYPPRIIAEQTAKSQ